MPTRMRQRAEAYFQRAQPRAWMFGADTRYADAAAGYDEMVGRLIVVDPGTRTKLRVFSLDRMDNAALLAALARDADDLFERLEAASALVADDDAAARPLPVELPYAGEIVVYTDHLLGDRRAIVETFEQCGLAVRVIAEPTAGDLAEPANAPCR